MVMEQKLLLAPQVDEGRINLKKILLSFASDDYNETAYDYINSSNINAYDYNYSKDIIPMLPLFRI